MKHRIILILSMILLSTCVEPKFVEPEKEVEIVILDQTQKAEWEIIKFKVSMYESMFYKLAKRNPELKQILIKMQKTEWKMLKEMGLR